MIVESAYDMPGVSAKLNLVYVINNAGAVKGDPEADCRQECQSIEHVPFRSADAYARAALKPLNTMDAVRLKTILTVIIAPT